MMFTVSAPGRTRPGAAVMRSMTAAQAQPFKRRITLYNAEWCWYCQRVRKKLDELGLEYDVVEVPIRHSERKDVMRISGQSSVPVLVDGDTVLDDDDVIIPYLERTYGVTRYA
ncbi:MAG TPA: glutaredoxin family protein [Candidatus Acidoferrales bacterium]|nr:glutaredoxin family protein [Candidatus Acidoferrales bacterium]